MSDAGKEIAILREVISDRKLEQAGRYVIYSRTNAICCGADGYRILTTSVEPSARIGNGWKADTPLRLNLLFITQSTIASGVGNCGGEGGRMSSARCHARISKHHRI